MKLNSRAEFDAKNSISIIDKKVYGYSESQDKGKFSVVGMTSKKNNHNKRDGPSMTSRARTRSAELIGGSHYHEEPSEKSSHNQTIVASLNTKASLKHSLRKAQALGSGLTTPTRSISGTFAEIRDHQINFGSMNILTGGGAFDMTNDLKTLQEIEASTGSYLFNSSKRSAVAVKSRQ